MHSSSELKTSLIYDTNLTNFILKRYINKHVTNISVKKSLHMKCMFFKRIYSISFNSVHIGYCA